MLTYGDGLADIDLNALLKSHLNSSKICTLSAVHPAGRFGGISIGDDGLVSNFVEKPLKEKAYINGGFMVTVQDRDDPNIEADYTHVHFSLLTSEFLNSSVYVYGGFNNFATTAENRMVYNSKKGIYETSILMKQGFYNYKWFPRPISKSSFVFMTVDP